MRLGVVRRQATLGGYAAQRDMRAPGPEEEGRTGGCAPIQSFGWLASLTGCSVGCRVSQNPTRAPWVISAHIARFPVSVQSSTLT
jgi:hypothetical protein